MSPSASLTVGPEAVRPIVTIRSGGHWPTLRLAELWEYRELLYFLVWRDVRVRYKQTLLGAAWAVVQPFLTMVVFSVFFGRLAGMPSDGVPYPIFVYCALLPWQLFAFSLAESSTSVVANQRLLTKVYFPRLLLPMAAVCVGLVDFAVSFVLLLAMMAYFGMSPGLAIVTVPVWAGLAVVTALAVGLWLSALNVRYRDIRYTVPFLSQIWLFCSPVAYPSSLVPAEWRSLFALNPMVGVIDGFRWALLGADSLVVSSAAVSTAVVAILLISGLFYFRHSERTFADVI